MDIEFWHYLVKALQKMHEAFLASFVLYFLVQELEVDVLKGVFLGQYKKKLFDVPALPFSWKFETAVNLSYYRNQLEIYLLVVQVCYLFHKRPKSRILPEEIVVLGVGRFNRMIIFSQNIWKFLFL